MNLDELWQGIEAASPLRESVGFDPLMVADVLLAERSTAQYERRKSFVANYAWAVPTRASISGIAEFVSGRELLEIYAGTGLWASLLTSHGVGVVATDAAPVPAAAHFPVKTLDAEQAIRSHPECQALMMCWPPFKDPSAFYALQAFQGDQLVYIGDTRFSGDGKLHMLIQDEWTPEREIALPSWPGTRDSVRLYSRLEG